MTVSDNPFECLEAINLPNEMILDYYIEDFNYSRFIQSKRNVLLVGERGCGKSMTLLYNSWPLQRLKAERASSRAPVNLIGVYIPCNTPLTHKSEFHLMEDSQASVISEHYLVLSVVYHIAETLAAIPDVMEGADEETLRSRIEFIFDAELPSSVPFFTAIMDFLDKENNRTQRAVNNPMTAAVSYEHTYTFSSIVVPMLGCTRSIPKLDASHFLLLIDDAHDLNTHQRHALNSWIAYRDHSLFSFKVAIASIVKSSLKTASGGTILEGHDYTRLDMAQPFHNDRANFGQHAQRLVARRLEKFGLPEDPNAFFPISDKLNVDLAKSEAAVRQEAIEKYGKNSARKRSDYVYKYKRAHYFRNRSTKANRPEYSGFDTLVYLSTGVIRNLLTPMYWMYDKMLSLASQEKIECIPHYVQNETILDRSRALWDFVRDDLDQTVAGCNREDAIRCYQLLDNLAIHFRDRLLNHKSEPRANSFTISGREPKLMENLERLFRILREAQLLYVRSGAAKDKGKREPYYVLNRMLWPERGLDPHGQHARVSLSATELWAAASDNDEIAVGADEFGEDQLRLFDE